MANPEHLNLLTKGATVWNGWRYRNPEINPDLSKAFIDRAMFNPHDILDGDNSYNLRHANFQNATLLRVDGHYADLAEANLEGARISDTDLSFTHLRAASFRNATLDHVIFDAPDLSQTDFSNAHLRDTIFANVDLSVAQGLDTIQHIYPSDISISTIYKSNGNISEVFLRGCGVPETMITFAKSLVGKPIRYYSAFISYSSADEHFARRLHNDLQMNGVRVWFAPKDLKTGDPLKQTIDESIRLYDKLILVLSEDSIHSAWVRHEFASALQKERQHDKLVLFPIRLDDAVFATTEQWAYDLQERYIGDFREWTNPLKYQAAFNRLLQDLNARA